MKSNEKSIGLYIHIPFCKSKCYYCDFNSFAGREELTGPYFEALGDEIRYYSGRLKNCKIKTIFIGGGTPSLVEARHIYEILNSCRQHFNLEESVEISIETNPGTLTYEKLMMYKASGINRLSIGLQAWQDRLLQELGRIHRMDEFIENYNLAKKVGFKNINVDLIFGLPGQRMNDWIESVVNVPKLGATHISCYSLKIEDDTVFGNRLAEGELIPADDELDREMYYFAIDKLSKLGFHHYEISNFAKPGYECRHNLTYWRAEEYLGVGAGAHSYLEGKRFNNICKIEDYISFILNQELPVENVELIDKKDAMSEFLILGLRLIDGISMSEFKSRFDEDIFNIFGNEINKLLRKQLIEQDGDRLKLTETGLDVANKVFVEFL